jgi:hypothetical protein
MPDPEFDLQYWLSVFAIERMRARRTLGVHGRQITSPFDLAIVEQLRKEERDLGPTVPCDVFVFAKGESARREGTKIGGMPYRPAHLPWPTTSDDHTPMTFLGQLNFVNSKDVTGPLPGDVLLVFARDEVLAMDDPDALRFEWYPEGLTELVGLDAVPKPGWCFVVCHGHRHRTVDFPDGGVSLGVQGSWKIAVLEGTKIGGVPPFRLEIEEHGGMPGRYLASIGSIEPAVGCPYPWLNEPSQYAVFRSDEKQWMRHCGAEDVLEWGDAGVLSFFLDEKNAIHWMIECY